MSLQKTGQSLRRVVRCWLLGCWLVWGRGQGAYVIVRKNEEAIWFICCSAFAEATADEVREWEDGRVRE